jgi:hypothetical protein
MCNKDEKRIWRIPTVPVLLVSVIFEPLAPLPTICNRVEEGYNMNHFSLFAPPDAMCNKWKHFPKKTNLRALFVSFLILSLSPP